MRMPSPYAPLPIRRTAVGAALAFVAAFFLGGVAGAGGNKNAERKEPTAAQVRIAQAMAAGHAYEKHVVEEKLFPEVRNPKEFAEVIARVLANPTHHRKLENDREAYFDGKSNTIVIYNPHARDKGTCFRPRAGLKYYQGLK